VRDVPQEPQAPQGGQEVQVVQSQVNEGAAQQAPEVQEQTQQMGVYVVRTLTRLPSAFQLLVDGWVMKISLVKVADCSRYMSRSGLTWSGCFKWTGDDLREVRGLYIVRESERVTYYQPSKIDRDIKAFKEWLLEKLKGLADLGLIPTRALVVYSNYWFSVYASYKKTITIYTVPWTYHGRLKVYKVVEPETYIEPKEANTIEVYNHKVVFDKNVHMYEADTYGTGRALLVYAPSDVELHLESPDHPAASATLSAGWYLFVHPRPRGGAD
jgi:hypothetical protein